MNRICPNCEKITVVSKVTLEEEIKIRGDKFVVPVEFFKCSECDESFENTDGHDSLEVAYSLYRKKYGFLQPDQIRDWRKSFGLTQKELSDILGWGGATLSRYENGALQEEAHDKLLRLAMEPHNLLKLIRETPQALGADKRDRIVSELSVAEKEACSIERAYEETFSDYQPDHLSGYRKFDFNKFTNTILFFCKHGGQLKTKLNKLLFYADFKCFKESTISITGSRYAHIPYGPVPDNYDFYYASLRKKNDITVDEVMVYKYVGECIIANKDVDTSYFSPFEIEVLNGVLKYFKDFNASDIKDFSHKERGYAETCNGELISYNYASSLQI